MKEFKMSEKFKKIAAVVFTLVFINLMFTSCFRISRPEDLLKPPELNKEKKEMKEAVEKFRPQNTNIYPVYVKDSKKTLNMIISDIDGNFSNEIISFYKSKVDDKIGMFILEKVNSIWVKKFETYFDTYEISGFTIKDISDDGKKEIIVESYESKSEENPINYSIIYYDNDKFYKINGNSCIIMKLENLSDSKNSNILAVEKGEKAKDYFLKIYGFNNNKLSTRKSYLIKNIKNPYDMIFGNIFDEQMGIFIDYFEDEVKKNTKILLINEKFEIKDLDSVRDFAKHKYVFDLPTVKSRDNRRVNVGYKFLPPNIEVNRNLDENNLVNGYFKILKDYSLEMVSQTFENKELNYTINLPSTFNQNYTIKEYEGENKLMINYIDPKGNQYPIINISKIKKYEWEREKVEDKDIKLIIETKDYIVAGKILDYSDELQGREKEEYLKMKKSVIDLSTIVKENRI